MPIYEFYCADCHALYSFFSQRVDTRSRPDCPKCKRRRLERKPSTFATPRGGGEAAEPGLDSLDDAKLEEVVGSLAREMETLDQVDEPAAVARLMRRIGDASGLEPGPGLSEVLERLEAGEDPEALEEQLEAELGEDAGLEDLFRARRASADRRRPPRVDDTLYFL